MEKIQELIDNEMILLDDIINYIEEETNYCVLSKQYYNRLEENYNTSSC